MDELAAKKRVVKAGLDLIEKGLIARTWGNVSCRVDTQTFAVTPSGRAYEGLAPENIVLCSIADASYSGEIKPSSERGVHALIYRQYPNVNFVIHTHQTFASAVSVMGRPQIPGPFSSDGEPVPIAAYGLPSTKKLCREVDSALSKTGGRALIMAHHGAVCFGESCEEAFAAALALEDISRAYIASAFEETSGRRPNAESALYDYYCKQHSVDFPAAPKKIGASRRHEKGFVLTLDRDDTLVTPAREHLMPEAELHAEIYRRRPDVAFIVPSASAPLTALSAAGSGLIAMLDDFAQIVGRRVLCARSEAPDNVVGALGKRAGVLVPGCGALCCAASQSDAQAVRLVMEKDAYAQIAASLTGKPRPLSPADCLIMRAIYTLSYSKKQ